MDPATILGLTCNVLQLIELGYKGAALCWSLYKNGEDVDAAQLNETCDALSRAYQDLEDSLSKSSSSPPSPDEAILVDLCTKCEETSSKLRAEMITLTLQPKSGVFRIIGKALKSAYKADKIRRLETQLDNLARTMDTQVLIIVYWIAKQSSISVQSLEMMIDRRSSEIANKIVSGQLQLTNLISTEALACRGTMEKQHQATKDHLNAIHAEISETISKDGSSTRLQVDKISAQLDNLKLENQRRETFDLFMMNLKYPEMFDRPQSIEPAHRGTCEYVFKVDSFKRWLENDAELMYWIQGKAGSGKSTLMSFLMEASKDESGFIKTGLRKWNRNEPVSILSFYFWESGTLLQRNTGGLLRSLLRQLLNLLRSSVDSTSSVEKLGKTTHGAFHDNSWKITDAFCIMLDGLDEFGDDLDVLDLVESLRLLSNVKLCVSSRPSEIFKEYFEDYPKVVLQKLTEPAIETYVKERLQQNKTFERLMLRGAFSAADFIRSILAKADGVFLWVKLVVKDLLKGLKLKDDLTVLKKRLEKLPNGIFALYEHMWRRNVDHEFYEEEAARHFGLLNYAHERSVTLSLLQWGLAVNRELRSRCLSAIGDLDRPWFDFELDHEHLMTRIGVCTAGLIEVRYRNNYDPESEPDLSDVPTAKVIHRASSLEIHPIHKTAIEFYRRSPPLQKLAHLQMGLVDYSQCYMEVRLISNGLSILTQTVSCENIDCGYIPDDDSSTMWFEMIEQMVNRITRETNFKGLGLGSRPPDEDAMRAMLCTESRCQSVFTCIGAHTVVDATPWALTQNSSHFVIHRINSRAYSQKELNNLLYLWARHSRRADTRVLQSLLQKGADSDAKPLARDTTVTNPFQSLFTDCIFALTGSLIFYDHRDLRDLDTEFYQPVSLLCRHSKDPCCRTSPDFERIITPGRRFDENASVIVQWCLSDFIRMVMVDEREVPEETAKAACSLEPLDDGISTRAIGFTYGRRFWPINAQVSKIIVDNLRRRPRGLLIRSSSTGEAIIDSTSQFFTLLCEMRRRTQHFESFYDVCKHVGWTAEQIETWKDFWQLKDKQLAHLISQDGEDSNSDVVPEQTKDAEAAANGMEE